MENAEYTNEEYADMIFIYGKADGNGRKAHRLYSEAYPDRKCPHHETFKNIFIKLRETGSFSRRSGQGRQQQNNMETADRILEHVTDNPTTSVRKLSEQFHMSRTSVSRILQNNLLYPYHIQRVQALTPEDFQPRLQFCQTMLRHINRYPNFLSKILFTDEASFGRDGVFNFHNSHVYDHVNPHAIFQSKHQHRFPALNVWAGILGNNIFGPVYLPNRLNGDSYLNFIRNDLPNLLDDVPMLQVRHHYFMHDGAPAHFVRPVRGHLNDTYGRRWIGRGGPIPWPARSPDLNPLDFCLWGWIKSMVYKTEVDTEAELRQRIADAFCHIRHRINQDGIKITENMNNRVEKCIEMNGEHFEHLL